MAEMLNNCFAKVFTQEDTEPPIREQETNSELSSTTFTEKKIIEKIARLKEHSAPGPDGISSQVLKTARKD